MVEIELPHGIRATCSQGRWTCPESADLARALNAPWNQPDPLGHQLDPDLDCANHAVKAWGAIIVRADVPRTVPGAVY